MQQAIQLAKLGNGWVNPNPMVGAVIVKNDQIIGQGYHEKYGDNHAELNAIMNCRTDPIGSTLYVTLEPCCHYGKTPPCLDMILKAKFKRVVIGALDPNPIVSKKSIKALKSHKIAVTVGVKNEACERLIRVFKKYILTKTPYVVMKYAMTTDGKIATKTGKSKYISGTNALQLVHQMRHYCQAIMVGVNTVIADDPKLTCRIPNKKNPIRIICDTKLITPTNAYVVKTAKMIPTIIATSEQDLTKHKPYLQAGCETLITKKKDDHLDLNDLMMQLAKKQIDSVLLEGGASLNWSALVSQIVDLIHVDVSPKIFGGSFAKTPVMGLGVDEINQAIKLKNQKYFLAGNDLIIESEIDY